MKMKAASCKRIERAAGTPIESQKAACFTGSRSGQFGPLYNNDFDPATTEIIGGAGADHTASANHNAHESPLGTNAESLCCVRVARTRRYNAGAAKPAKPHTTTQHDKQL